jgi:crotonobetainyl-CoA:carnitine CoA-transferase CaiB-like acyl-CoA transferase
MLALYERERSGRGQFIDISLMDSVLGMLIYEMQAGAVPARAPAPGVRAGAGRRTVRHGAAVTQKNLECCST